MQHLKEKRQSGCGNKPYNYVYSITGIRHSNIILTEPKQQKFETIIV